MTAAPTHQCAIHCAQVAAIKREGCRAKCVLSEGGSVLVSDLLAGYIAPGDELELPLALDSIGARTELYIRKNAPWARSRDVYQAPIGYVTKPRQDKREAPYVVAEVPDGQLGISTIRLRCTALRDYFYVNRNEARFGAHVSFYDILKASPGATATELRLAYKLRELELRGTKGCDRLRAALERAFNILAQPELRAYYGSLLIDPEAAVPFPYGGFGSLLVEGERSRDGKTFFARRICAFLPDCRQRRFKAPLRRFEFYRDRAFYRDPRRKLELMVDQAAMPLVWDATWNLWKHLLPTKVDVRATFVATGTYRKQPGEWKKITWETALPSRIQVTLPAAVQEQIETARKTFHRFGQFSDLLDRIRDRIEREPVEKRELEKTCRELGIPADFDVAQITWRPDYDAFFYRQLAKDARAIYLFRDEYIFDLEHAVAVETPQLGHATYLFAKPRAIEAFLGGYAGTAKNDIRGNRGNIAERLGFIGRIVHGTNARTWFKELTSRLGVGCENELPELS